MELSEEMYEAAHSSAPDTLAQLARHSHPDVRYRAPPGLSSEDGVDPSQGRDYYGPMTGVTS